MVIGVLSDVHGNYKALEAVIDDMTRLNVESVIVLGDIIFNGKEPQQCYKAIKDLNPIAWIKGNTDDWFNEIDEAFEPSNEIEVRIFNEYKRVMESVTSDLISFIKDLPESKEVVVEGISVLCVHGSDRKINEPIGIMTTKRELHSLFDRVKSKMILCGHTHSVYIAAADGKVVMNVGSVGFPDDEDRPSYGILRIEDGNLEYGIRRVSIVQS